MRQGCRAGCRPAQKRRTDDEEADHAPQAQAVTRHRASLPTRAEPTLVCGAIQASDEAPPHPRAHYRSRARGRCPKGDPEVLGRRSQVVDSAPSTRRRTQARVRRSIPQYRGFAGTAVGRPQGNSVCAELPGQLRASVHGASISSSDDPAEVAVGPDHAPVRIRPVVSPAGVPTDLGSSRVASIVVLTEYPSLALPTSLAEGLYLPTRRTANHRFDLSRRLSHEQPRVGHHVVNGLQVLPDRP